MSHYHSATTASAATPTPGNGEPSILLYSSNYNYCQLYGQLLPNMANNFTHCCQLCPPGGPPYLQLVRNVGGSERLNSNSSSVRSNSGSKSVLSNSSGCDYETPRHTHTTTSNSSQCSCSLSQHTQG